jgi:diketogulonate reductase-like aldo/keto reductase
MVHYPADWAVTKTGAAARQAEWQALEEIYYAGKARSIGVSHYCQQHLDDILQIATVRPSLNQIIYHVGSGDVDHVMQYCRDHQITFMSFSPLCGPCKYDPKDSLIDGDLVTDIAKNYPGVVTSGSQVSLRFIVQQALENDSYIGGVIPKSNNEEHIQSNLNIFSFELSDEDMKRLRQATRPATKTTDCDVP